MLEHNGMQQERPRATEQACVCVCVCECVCVCVCNALLGNEQQTSSFKREFVAVEAKNKKCTVSSNYWHLFLWPENEQQTSSFKRDFVAAEEKKKNVSPSPSDKVFFTKVCVCVCVCVCVRACVRVRDVFHVLCAHSRAQFAQSGLQSEMYI
jgi:hypothetical protein